MKTVERKLAGIESIQLFTVAGTVTGSIEHDQIAAAQKKLDEWGVTAREIKIELERRGCSMRSIPSYGFPSTPQFRSSEWSYNLDAAPNGLLEFAFTNSLGFQNVRICERMGHRTEHGIHYKYHEDGHREIDLNAHGWRAYAWREIDVPPVEPSTSHAKKKFDSEAIDAWLSANCGTGVPYREATNLKTMLHGLAYVLRQIESSKTYKVSIGQVGSVTSALRMALSHFATVALSEKMAPHTNLVSVPEELLNLTFAIQHNPNCPSRWLVRLPGKGPIDFKPYGDALGIVKHETGDRLGFGGNLEEATQAALSSPEAT
jgi:hypothetical protein